MTWFLPPCNETDAGIMPDHCVTSVGPYAVNRAQHEST